MRDVAGSGLERRAHEGDAKLAELGHDPRITLEEGLPLTVEWMKKVYREGN